MAKLNSFVLKVPVKLWELLFSKANQAKKEAVPLMLFNSIPRSDELLVYEQQKLFLVKNFEAVEYKKSA